MYNRFLDKTVYINLPQGNLKGIITEVTKKRIVLLTVDPETGGAVEYTIKKKAINYIAESVNKKT